MKSILAKITILLAVFIAVSGGYLYVNYERDEEEDILMGEARIPVITTMVEGKEVNKLHGYTQDMDAMYMRDDLILIPENHKLNLNIKKYKAGILAISYEVRDMSKSRLIENTKVDKWEADGKNVKAVLDINNMIDKDTEYLLIVKLTTEDFANINYYARIVEIPENHFVEHTDFITSFNDAIFDKDKAESIVKYLEPKGSQDNSNFGYANIHSSFSHITWGDLSPEKISDSIIQCKEISGNTGSYELTYRMKAKSEYDEEQYYNVVEDYRVKWTESTMYLLDYERRVNQEFVANNQNISGSRINVGIDYDMNINTMASESRNFVTFTKERTLWLMDIKQNKIIKVFDFKSEKSSDLRDTNTNHDIEIVSVDDKGDTKFIVYGYMNRGEHEGNVGVSLYSYSREQNECEELLFIPFTKSYEILKESIGKLSYVSENIMYIMINDCVYSIDLVGDEYVQIISGLDDGMYAMNEKGDIFAWQANGGVKGATKIKVLNFKDGKEYVVSAKGKNRLKVIGFIEDDLVYASAATKNITVDKNGYVTMLLDTLKIVNSDKEVLKEYKKSGTFFTSAEVKGNMINLKRCRYDETGNLVAATDYQIFGNTEEDEDKIAVDTIVTELKKTEVVINFVYKITTSDKLKKITPNDVKFENTNSLSIRELSTNEGFYYVYSYGKVYGVYTKEAQAIKRADEVSGVVLDSQGDYLWRKISRPTEYCLSGINVDASSGNLMEICLKSMLAYNGTSANITSMLQKNKSSLQIINSKLKGRALDLSGCSLSEVLYYVHSAKQPVMGMKSSNEPVLIVGYNVFNVILVNPVTGEQYMYGLDDASKMFELEGNRFVGIKEKKN